MTYTHFDTPATKAAAMALTRGVFQRALLDGVEAWSAMTVNNRSRGHYKASGDALRERLVAAGFAVERVSGLHNRREYRIATPAGGLDAAKVEAARKVERAVAVRRDRDEPRMFLPNGRVDGDDYSYETHSLHGGNTVWVRVHPIRHDGGGINGLPVRILAMPYSADRPWATLSRLETARLADERADIECIPDDED